MASRSVAVGVFGSRTEVDRAYAELLRLGFSRDEVGVVVRGAEGAGHVPGVSETHAEEGGVAGAVAGAATGGLAGWAATAGLITIPGIGPVLAAGWVATLLGGLAAGAAAGGVLGTLVGMGIPEEELRAYRKELEAGRTLLVVKAGPRYSEAVGILRTYGGLVHQEPGAAAE